MKKFAKAMSLVLALVMLLALCACGGTEESTAPESTAPESTAPESEAPESEAPETAEFTTVEEGKLILATNCQFPPYEMVADGEGVYQGYEGIDIEIALKIAEALNLELVIDDMEFTSSLLAVQEGRSDILLAGLTYNEEREEVMDFTTPYATGIQVVIVKEGSDVTMDNLGDGKLIGTQSGTTGYEYASAPTDEGGYGEEAVIAYDSGATAVQALLNGQVDAVIIDKAPAEAYVAANDGLTILPSAWVEEDYCIAVDEGNTALLNAVQAVLDDLMESGELDAIVAKYINAD